VRRFLSNYFDLLFHIRHHGNRIGYGKLADSCIECLCVRHGGFVSASQAKPYSSASSSAVSQPLLPSSVVSSDYAVSKSAGSFASGAWPVEDYFCPFHHLATEW